MRRTILLAVVAVLSVTTAHGQDIGLAGPSEYMEQRVKLVRVAPQAYFDGMSNVQVERALSVVGLHDESVILSADSVPPRDKRIERLIRNGSMYGDPAMVRFDDVTAPGEIGFNLMGIVFGVTLVDLEKHELYVASREGHLILVEGIDPNSADWARLKKGVNVMLWGPVQRMDDVMLKSKQPEQEEDMTLRVLRLATAEEYKRQWDERSALVRAANASGKAFETTKFSTFTDNKGRSVKAVITGRIGTAIIKLTLPNGDELRVPIANLSDASKDVAGEWIRLDRQRDQASKQGYGGSGYGGP